MPRRDVIILVVVLAGIGWLLLENYHRSHTKPAQKPATIEHAQPLTK
ncbi:MAG: hypothetical protein JSR37_07870 [Verrucomicrobia bacterium]|nr:hypothetical protein [Verrucomicrobiota bacterium]MBS0638198.1 hypothetical protein [Verrucomicrobiota bacterium]